MNSLKLLGAGLLAASCLTTSAFAVNTTVRITGSTAYRKATYNAIMNILTAPTCAAVGGKADGSDMTGANLAVIKGTIKAGQPHGVGDVVTFECAFAGSVGGIQVLDQGLLLPPGISQKDSGGTALALDAAHVWLADTNVMTAISPGVAAGSIKGYKDLLAPVGGLQWDANHVATASNSDSFQTSTPFNATVLSEENSVAGGIGVVEFYWLKGQPSSATVATAAANFTNVNNLQLQQLLSAGTVPLSQFTGNSADSGIDVVLCGRNSDSGTRLDAEADSAYGFAQTEIQYQPNADPITALVLAPGGGDNGYSSGGNLAAALRDDVSAGTTDLSGNPFILVGYLGRGDKNTAIGAASANQHPATVLTYNGTTYSDAAAQEGQYSFWSYEHTYYIAGLAGAPKDCLDDMSLQIRNTDYTWSGLALSGMHVSRSVEGGVISHN